MHRMLIAAAVMAAGSTATAEDYRAEAEFLANEIVETHPRGAEIAADPAFIAARDALFAMASDADLAHYAMAAGRMFHAANDGHTALIPVYSEIPEFQHRYPIRVMRFVDGLYVVSAKGDAAPLLGARLTRVAGKDVNAILRDFAAAQASGNRAWPTNWTRLALTIPGVLAGLDVAPDAMTAPVRFEGVKGRRKVSASLLPSADGADGQEEIERIAAPLEGRGDGAENFVLELDHALIFVVGAMEDGETKSMEEFTREAWTAMEVSEADRLVIDLRDNGGGNNMLIEPLRRLIIKSRFNRAGGIYVLTSPQTFSAAQNFATRLERETAALFVGEPTGGSPNHFGDPKFAAAEQSGLVYIVSTLRWQDMPPFDERPWILPDIPAPPQFEAYVGGRDLALEAAMIHEAGEDPEWWRRAMEPWSRPTQQGDWRFFYELDD